MNVSIQIPTFIMLSSIEQYLYLYMFVADVDMSQFLNLVVHIL